MSRGVKIRYGDVAPGAKESFIPTTDDKLDFVILSDLSIYNPVVPNFANPCEAYQAILDGSQEMFPEHPEENTMGLWSDSVSGADGAFADPPMLTLAAGEKFTSQGITLTFDKDNGIFAKDINIKWYREGTLLYDVDFTPDSAEYFARQYADYYDTVVITFRALNAPQNRLKLRCIDYGYGTFFFGDELRGVSIIQELDPMSESIFTNVCDFTLHSKTDMEYDFQRRQTMDVYFNDRLSTTAFVDDSERIGRRQWSISTCDHIGLLEHITFTGGIYVNENAEALLSSIFTQAKIPFNISAELESKTVSGYIPICSCRQAVQMICFAIGAVATEAGRSEVCIAPLSSAVAQTVEKRRIKQGQSFKNGEKLTELRLTVHTYSPSTEEMTVYTAADDDVGVEVWVEFTEPLHSLSINNGTILQSGANFAVIEPLGTDCELKGKKYNHTTSVKSKRNPLVYDTDIECVKEISEQTIVSASNAGDILERCYDYYSKNMTTTVGIYESRRTVKFGELKFGEFKYGQQIYDDPVEIGERITLDTEYLGRKTGRVIREKFNLNGTILLKECEVVLDN